MRAPARAPRDADDASVADQRETLTAHAKRVLRTRLAATACGVLDPCIALLQRLRTLSGCAPDANAEAGEDAFRPGKAKGGRGRDAEAGTEAAEAEAPKPKRRLLTFLIYFSILLAGGMGGGALAYELLASLLERQGAESRRVEAALSKQSKSTASNEQKLAQAEAKRAEAETKLAEAKARQAEVEKKLEAALNDSKAVAEKQKKLDEAVKLLDSLRGAPAGRSGTEGKARAPKSGDCTMVAGNVSALKECLEGFNR
jgi:hypothetical protein